MDFSSLYFKKEKTFKEFSIHTEIDFVYQYNVDWRKEEGFFYIVTIFSKIE